MESKLNEPYVTHQNPGTDQKLIIPCSLVPTIEQEQSRQNVKTNAARTDIPWLMNTLPHNGVAVIVGAGPSLKDSVEAILAFKQIGGLVYSCNSATAFLNEHGIVPHYHVVLDPMASEGDFGEAREYLIASVCPPEWFDKYQPCRMWHAVIEDIEGCIPKGKDFVGIGGGVTVGNSALCLAYTMGYREIHAFGFDSSFDNGRTHATDQPACSSLLMSVNVGDKDFSTTYTMKRAAEVFMELRSLMKEAGAEVHVHGTGLLPSLCN